MKLKFYLHIIPHTYVWSAGNESFWVTIPDNKKQVPPPKVSVHAKWVQPKVFSHAAGQSFSKVRGVSKYFPTKLQPIDQIVFEELFHEVAFILALF